MITNTTLNLTEPAPDRRALIITMDVIILIIQILTVLFIILLAISLLLNYDDYREGCLKKGNFMATSLINVLVLAIYFVVISSYAI